VPLRAALFPHWNGHYNTEHPRVHVALRGIGAVGRPLRLDRDYIRQGIREIAGDLCARQLGYRSEFDAAVAQRREEIAHRYTSLDRAIKRDALPAEDLASTFLTVALDMKQAGINANTRLSQQYVSARLMALETMGLAGTPVRTSGECEVIFEDVLRAMQRSADRQKMLAAHGVLLSDERLPMVVFDLRDLTTLEGRILVHGEEETGRQAGRSYLMLEGTDGRVHYLYYTPEMDAARNRGGLRTNSFIRLRKLFSEGRPRLEIEELGDSQSIFRNQRYLRETAQCLIRRGIIPQEDGWNGWLGRYQKALAEAATTLEGQRVTKRAERDRHEITTVNLNAQADSRPFTGRVYGSQRAWLRKSSGVQVNQTINSPSITAPIDLREGISSIAGDSSRSTNRAKWSGIL
jgi:hypothetical protein